MALQGSGQGFNLELVRETLLEGIVSLAGDDVRLESIFERRDSGLLYGRWQGPTEWSKDATEWLKRTVSESHVEMVIGPPGNDAQLPCISIELAGENDTQEDVAAYEIERSSVTIKGKCYLEHVKGRPVSLSVGLGILSTVPEEARWLHMVAGHVMFADYGKLIKAGLYDISLNAPAPFVSESWPHIPLIYSWNVSLKVLTRYKELEGPLPSSVVLNTPRGSV